MNLILDIVMLVSIGEASAVLGVSISTLRRWEKEKRLIPACRTLGDHRRYNLNVLQDLIQGVSDNQDVTVCYARESGHDQRNDFTSIIGKAKFMGRYGITPHESAAMAIARRAQRYKEKVPAHNACEPLAKMAHQHVWKSWSLICKDKVIKKKGHHIFYNWRSLQDATGFILQKYKSYGEILVSKTCGTKV